MNWLLWLYSHLWFNNTLLEIKDDRMTIHIDVYGRVVTDGEYRGYIKTHLIHALIDKYHLTETPIKEHKLGTVMITTNGERCVYPINNVPPQIPLFIEEVEHTIDQISSK